MKEERIRKTERGITLITLVITIIVLLILAGISIATLTGENGLLAKAEAAKEVSEMAQIKEESDFVKIGLDIDALSKQNEVAIIEKSKLINELKKHFEGSTIEEGRVVVKDGRYDIIVKRNLEIVVVKHGENYLKDDEIGITYEIQDVDKMRKTIKVYLEVATKIPSKEGYKEFVNQYLSDKSTAELEEIVLKSIHYKGTFDEFLAKSGMTREQFEQMAQEQGMTYDEYLKYGLIEGMGEYSCIYIDYVVQFVGGEGKTQAELENLIVELMEYPGTFDEYLTENGLTRDDLSKMAQMLGYETEVEIIKYLVMDTYMNKTNEEITVQCSNGESDTTNVIEAYVEFTVTKDGTYTIVATTESGKRGEINVKITGVGEKFSQIYTETKEYVDGKGNKAIIPAGFAVGLSDGINTIENGLVITDSVDSKGYSIGSEFVWVPVDSNLRAAGIKGKEMAELQNGSTTNYQGVLYDFTGTGNDTTSSKIEMGTIGGDTGKREPDIVKFFDNDTKPYLSEIGLTQESFQKQMQEDYNKMIESVKKYEGFYVGRYETSIKGGIVASKKGVFPMHAGASSGNSWYGMYQKQKEYASKNNLTSITSSMIWGSQYDAMLNWALTGNDKGKVTANTNGNHMGITIVLNTGDKITDKINNIYDLEGNMCEWCLEARDNSDRAMRGGSHFDNYSPSHRDSFYTISTNEGIGSRLVLWM